MTNLDKIKQMSLEEMEKFMIEHERSLLLNVQRSDCIYYKRGYCTGISCAYAIHKWLGQEFKNDYNTEN